VGSLQHIRPVADQKTSVAAEAGVDGPIQQRTEPDIYFPMKTKDEKKILAAKTHNGVPQPMISIHELGGDRDDRPNRELESELRKLDFCVD